MDKSKSIDGGGERMSVNQFSYEIPTGKVRGYFDIYQANSGLVYMVMGNRFTKLEHQQIEELCIDVYSLKDFDHDRFMNAYGSIDKLKPIEITKKGDEI